LISGVVVGNATGFAAFDDVDPTIIGNSTGTGQLNGLDASWVAQKSIGLDRPEILDIPAGEPLQAMEAEGETLAVSLDDTMPAVTDADFSSNSISTSVDSDVEQSTSLGDELVEQPSLEPAYLVDAFGTTDIEAIELDSILDDIAQDVDSEWDSIDGQNGLGGLI